MSNIEFLKQENKNLRNLIHCILMRYHPDGCEISEILLESNIGNERKLNTFVNSFRGTLIFSTIKNDLQR